MSQNTQLAVRSDETGLARTSDRAGPDIVAALTVLKKALEGDQPAPAQAVALALIAARVEEEKNRAARERSHEQAQIQLFSLKAGLVKVLALSPLGIIGGIFLCWLGLTTVGCIAIGAGLVSTSAAAERFLREKVSLRGRSNDE